MKRVLPITFLALLFLKCSRNENPMSYTDLAGDWKLIAQDTLSGIDKTHPALSEFGLVSSPELTFYPDNTVEPYYHCYSRTPSRRQGEIIRFMGPTTRFKINGDSITLFNPTSSTDEEPRWTKSFAVQNLTKDSLVFQFTPAITFTYKRVIHNLDAAPTFDAIVATSRQCYGACTAASTIIKSDGSVFFRGEHKVEKLGLFEGRITKDHFTKIQDHYRKTDMKRMRGASSRDMGHRGVYSLTFVKDGKIYNTIEDFGYHAPDERLPAYGPLFYLHDYIPLKPAESHITPPYQEYTYYAFKKDSLIKELQDSEAFLLWYYLRSATITQQKAPARFRLAYRQNSLSPEDALPLILPIEIITDGQLYTFSFKLRPSVTLDLGFNFFDQNFTMQDLKPIDQTSTF